MSAGVCHHTRGHIRRAIAVTAAGAAAALLGLTPSPAAATTPPLLISRFAGTGTPAPPVAGAASSSPLGSPHGVALDAAGDLYIADPADNEVLEVTPSGTLSVIAGTGTAAAPVPGPATASPLNAPTGVAVDASGDLYIADTGNSRVERVTPGGTLSVIAGTGTAAGPVPGLATASPLNAPSGVAVDSSGDLYIADTGNADVEEVTPGGTLSVVAGDGTSATPVPGPAASSPLKAPTGVAVDPGGNLYIADSTANVVEKVAAGTLSIAAGKTSGAGTPTAGAATNSRLDRPTGVAVDASGNLYIADTTNDRIEKVAAGQLSVIAGNGRTGAPTYGALATSSAVWGPTGLAVTPSGTAYLADAANATVDQLVYAPPVDASAPGISGTATQGQTLSAGTGGWLDNPASYAYQWEDCNAAGAGCVAIAHATAATYALTPGDVGDTLRVIVTATNAGGSASATSASTAVVKPLPPVSTAAPAIAGSAVDGQTLTVTTGAWSNNPTSFTYQWEDCTTSCTDIAGATTTAYTLTPGDVGDTLRVIVTAANAGGSATTTSGASGTIGPALVAWANVAPPASTAAPVISGDAAPGQTLSCSTGGWTGDPTSFTYQWNRGTLQIANATNPTYTVTSADTGHPLSCSVLATNDGGAIQADSAGILVGAETSAGGAEACTPATGTATGLRLGPLSLGETRAQARKRLTRTAAGAHADRFCLAGGATIQAAYSSSALTASIARTHGVSTSGRLVLALTDDARYAVDRIHPGLTARVAARRHRLGRALRIGGGAWYVIPGARANAVVEIRAGRVAEVGIAEKGLSRGRAAQARLLRTVAG